MERVRTTKALYPCYCIDLEYKLVWFGTGRNSGVVEVAGIESTSFGEPTLFQQSIGITRQT